MKMLINGSWRDAADRAAMPSCPPRFLTIRLSSTSSSTSIRT